MRANLWISCAVMVAAGCARDPEVGIDAGTSTQAIGINGPGGWLRGVVHAGGYSTIVAPLPEVSLHAQNVVTLVNSPAVLSDFHGEFQIPLANGSYKLCSSKSGFITSCGATIYTINNKTKAVGAIALTPALQRKVRGTARLADGSSCLAIDKFMGVEIYGRADLVSPTNTTLYTTKLNFRGDWVLPNPGSGHKVRVTCGSVTAEALTAVMPASDPYAFTFANRRPFVRPISVRAGGVDVSQGVLPGTVVNLSSSAVDPDGNPLIFGWKATQGTLLNTGTTSAVWTAPSTPGVALAYLAANDGKGGYSTRTLELRVRTDPSVLFTGNVRDDSGAVVAGAEVQVGAVTTTSDAAGHFSMTVPEAPQYLLNISKMGFAEYSRPLQTASNGRKYTLIKASAKPFNPGVLNVLVDDQRPTWNNPCAPQATCPRTGGRVTLPAGSVLLSPPPVGGLTMYLATYDVNKEPLLGDQTATSSTNQTVALGSYGALFIEIRDTVGTKYNLAPGKTAKIEIPMQSAILAEGPPAAMDMWKYGPATGRWAERPAIGAKVGNYYVLEVASFSTQNADIEKANPACLYVDVEDAIATVPNLSVRFQVPVSPGGAVRVYEIPLDEQRNTLYNLPTAAPYTLELFETIDGKKVLKLPLTGMTGGAWGGVGYPGDSEPGCTTQTIVAGDLADTNGAFSRFLSFKGIGDSAQATAYYAKIDPTGERDTLGEFWSGNGFDANGGAIDEHKAHFINFNDLGFGRDMHCRQNGGDTACYVTNYGGPDQAPGNYDLAKAAQEDDRGATVAMEYSNGPGGTKIVKFFAYGGGVAGSARILSANLDGAGEKYIPNLCLNCHGGFYPGNGLTTPSNDDVNMGSSFREFDIYSYRDGTLGDKPNELASGLHEITDAVGGQQAEFLELNKLVRATSPQAAISELVNIWYNNADTLPFNKDAVPAGWNANPGTQDLYLKVVARACRTCHVSQDGSTPTSTAWSTYDQFKNARPLIAAFVCAGDPLQPGFEETKKSRLMPHANVTFKNFWLDSAAYSKLGTFTGAGWASSINSEASSECIP
jgi:hypothetical protein